MSNPCRPFVFVTLIHGILLAGANKLPISEPGTLLREVTVTKPAVCLFSCYFSPCGCYLYYSEGCAEQGNVVEYWRLRVLELQTGRMQTLIPRVEVGSGNAAFSPDGQYLALPQEPDDLAVYSLPELRPIARYRLKNIPSILTFSSDGRYLFACAVYGHVVQDSVLGTARRERANQVVVYRTQDWKEVANIIIHDSSIPEMSYIYKILPVANSERFAVVCKGGVVVYDFDGTPISHLPPYTTISDVDIDTDNKILASSYITGEIRFFDLEKVCQKTDTAMTSWRPTYVIRALATSYAWLRFSPNGRWLFAAAGLYDPPHQDEITAHVIHVYNVETKQLDAIWRPAKDTKNTLFLKGVFSPDGKYLAVFDGQHSSTLRIWKLPEKYHKGQQK